MWCKQGLIFAPNGEWWWARKYAMLPTVEIINAERLRIYYASLDDNKFGRIGYIDVDAHNPQHILHKPEEPILQLGPLGSFDDSGVNPSCVITINGKKHLYYIGWQLCSRVPYMLFSGLATSKDGIVFDKHSQVPILDRTNDEPYSRSAPFVLESDGIFHMWYWSCKHWTDLNNKIHYNNVIKYASSPNGIQWNIHPEDVILPDFKDEFSVGRPWVIKENNLYKMWYSIRSLSRPYRIGYAESSNGIDWERKDHLAGIDRSNAGWDSEMICYPCVVDIHDKRYMFYNGNQHGSTGFGYAVFKN